MERLTAACDERDARNTYIIDFACLQSSPCETVIIIQLKGHFPSIICQHAQLKHFHNLSGKHALFNTD